jgi:N-acetyl-gamma-glutamyl-phosphate reductase
MTKAAILGARGYAGRELLRLLMGHPHVTDVRPISSSAAGEPIANHIPTMQHSDLQFSDSDAIKGADVVFLATDDSTAVDAMEKIGDDQVVIDLSRAHRQDGLAPGAGWSYGWADIEPVDVGNRRIANPGCYPTSAVLAMAPLLGTDLVGVGPIIVDGKSGVSGAGAKPREDLHFAAANESVRAYKVDGHDHGAEIQSAVRRLTSDGNARVRFTPHLVPQTRGLLTTCYIPAAKPIDNVSLAELVRHAYADSPFVHVVAEPDTAAVRGSNNAHVAIHYDADNQLFVARCAIDNLQKGAASTAVQNMNDALGWDSSAGLEAIAA